MDKRRCPIDNSILTYDLGCDWFACDVCGEKYGLCSNKIKNIFKRPLEVNGFVGFCLCGKPAVMQTPYGEMMCSDCYVSKNGDGNNRVRKQYYIENLMTLEFYGPFKEIEKASNKAINLNKKNEYRPSFLLIEDNGKGLKRIGRLYREFGHDFNVKNCWVKESTKEMSINDD